MLGARLYDRRPSKSYVSSYTEVYVQKFDTSDNNYTKKFGSEACGPFLLDEAMTLFGSKRKGPQSA